MFNARDAICHRHGKMLQPILRAPRDSGKRGGTIGTMSSGLGSISWSDGQLEVYRASKAALGEFTGYYGGTPGPQPVIEVKAVHRRSNPIVTAALMATYPSCEIGAYYAVMRSARIWDDLETIGVPGICGVYAHPSYGAGTNSASRNRPPGS